MNQPNQKVIQPPNQTLHLTGAARLDMTVMQAAPAGELGRWTAERQARGPMSIMPRHGGIRHAATLALDPLAAVSFRPKRPGAPALAWLLVPCLASCSGDGAGNAGHTVTDSAGVRIVVSNASSWGPAAARLDTTPVLRIGAEEPGPYQFSFVAAGLLLPNGTIAVSELATNEVRLFSSDGVHLGTLGRRGRGPGEFQLLAGLFPYAGDSLVAYDQRLRRTTILPIAGGDPRVIANPRPGNLSGLGLLASGELVLYNPGSGYRPDLAPGLQWDTTDIDLIDLATGSGTVIARLPSRQQFIEPDGNTRVLAPAHTAIHAVTGSGFYWATSDRYEIRFFGRDGQLQRVLRRPVEPRRVDGAMIAGWIAANLDRVRQFEGEAAVDRYRRGFDQGTYGELVPLFEQAFVDQDERLWVGEAVWPQLDGTPLRWSIFGADGGWLVDLVVPPGFRPLDSRADLVLGVWLDSADVPHVQVHRLIRP